MEQILSHFLLNGHVISCERFGSGHINATYRVETDAPHVYILQKINHEIFHQVDQLMENVSAVTSYLAQNEKDPRRVMQFAKTREGKSYYQDETGNYWRMCDFVLDSLSLDRPESAHDFYQSAVAFGRFQMQLKDFPADTLHETIPHFHDTPVRYEAFHRAIEADTCGRLASVQAEVDFALAREAEAGCMMRLLQEGKLPLRVTHNDTKLNNVLLDAKTREPLCVIDLDTVMPGLAANDFGDAIRFGASTAAEDEKDLGKVWMSLEMYEAFTRGFLQECGNSLTPLEIETLPMGAKLMTLECGVRFLTDYLAGDTYFATHYEGQNLDRCRTQFKLVKDMEDKWAEMAKIVRNLTEKKA